MATSSWKTGISGDWNTATNWNGPVPNSTAADVVIDAPATTAYTATIAQGADDIVNSLTLNPVANLSGVNASPYLGAVLEVDGVLTFAPTSKGNIDGPLQSTLLLNNGGIVNAGTINAFVQAGGTSSFTGQNPIYFTNWLQSIGVTTIDTASIAEYNPATKTLFDGIFEAKGDGAVVNLGGALGKDIVNIGTIIGPKPTLTPDFWTQVIFDSPTSAINEWNGTGYVSLESTLTTVGECGIVTVTGNRNYTTANALRIQKDGAFDQTSGTLTTGGLTIDSGGLLSNGVSAAGPQTEAASTDAGILTVAGNIVNNGSIEAFPGAIVMPGSITGTGTLSYGKTGGSIEVNNVAAGQTVAMTGNDILTLDSATGFKGAITASGAGNSVVLRGVTATSVVATGNTIQIKNGGSVVDTIATTGTISNDISVVQTAGNTTITIGGPAAPIQAAPPTVTTPPLTPPTPVGSPLVITGTDPSVKPIPDTTPRIPVVISTLPSSLITAALGLPDTPQAFLPQSPVASVGTALNLSDVFVSVSAAVPELVASGARSMFDASTSVTGITGWENTSQNYPSMIAHPGSTLNS